MNDTLEEFILTLPKDIQNRVLGFKNNKRIRLLKEYNIDIPQSILNDIEENKKESRKHENVISSMECFHGNKLEDFGIKV